MENLGYTSECYEKDINRMPDGIDELCGGTGELWGGTGSRKRNALRERIEIQDDKQGSPGWGNIQPIPALSGCPEGFGSGPVMEHSDQFGRTGHKVQERFQDHSRKIQADVRDKYEPHGRHRQERARSLCARGGRMVFRQQLEAGERQSAGRRDCKEYGRTDEGIYPLPASV